MKKSFFIADVHLDSAYSDRRELILSFLNVVKQETGDLYILGDFFDFWANNKIIITNNRIVLNFMRQMTAQGCRIYMLIGNRDLLLNQKVLSPFGITFLGEEAEVQINGKKVFLTHGYSLCAMDTKFHRYKKIAWPVYRVLDAILPGIIENYLARKFILKSKQVINSQDQSRFQFSFETINHIFTRGIDAIISGHAHKTAVEHHGEKSLYVLPSWDKGKGGYLLFHGGEFSSREFPETS